MNKDYKITADITVPNGGAEGMIATLGGRFSGYGLYLLKGKPVFVYNMSLHLALTVGLCGAMICRLLGEDRTSLAHRKTDPIDPKQS